MSLDVFRPVSRAVTTTAALLDGLTAAEKDELAARLAARGYKPELSATTRKTGESGGLIVAANAYKVFNTIGADVGGPGLLKALRRPCCGLPDRSWQDPDTGRPTERAITFGRWKPGYPVKVAYKFARIPEAGDAMDPALVRRCIATALELWSAYCGITLQLVDDFNAADVRCGDNRIDGEFGTLAYMELPGPGVVAAGTVCRGTFDHGESWGVTQGGIAVPPRAIDFLDVFVHEFGHALGLDHESGSGEERMNPMYWHAPHAIGEGTNWLGPKDTRTAQGAYGPPVAKPTPTPPRPNPNPTPTPTSGSLKLEGYFVGRTDKIAGGVSFVNGVFTGDHRAI